MTINNCGHDSTSLIGASSLSKKAFALWLFLTSFSTIPYQMTFAYLNGTQSWHAARIKVFHLPLPPFSTLSKWYHRWICSRVGGSYESSLVAANILLCTLFKPKSAKNGFKKAGNQLGLGLEDLLLWLPLHSRSVNRGSPKFQHFCYKSGWTNHIALFY